MLPSQREKWGITENGRKINQQAADLIALAQTRGTYLGEGRFSRNRYFECESIEEPFQKNEVTIEEDFLLANLLVLVGKLEPNATVSTRKAYVGIVETSPCYVNAPLLKYIKSREKAQFQYDVYEFDYDRKSHMVFNIEGDREYYTQNIFF